MKRFLAFALIATFAILLSILLTDCTATSTWPTLPTATEVEDVLIAETARFASLQNVKVRGEITDKWTAGQAASQPAGWYVGGVAYYHRGMVKKYVTIERTAGHETAANVACHEVCHAKNPAHDLAHWSCMSKWAEPTYTRP